MPSKHAITVSLTEHLDSFIRSELASGRYGTASEVVRAGLRLLEEQNMARRDSRRRASGTKNRTQPRSISRTAGSPSTASSE